MNDDDESPTKRPKSSAERVRKFRSNPENAEAERESQRQKYAENNSDQQKRVRSVERNHRNLKSKLDFIDTCKFDLRDEFENAKKVYDTLVDIKLTLEGDYEESLQEDISPDKGSLVYDKAAKRGLYQLVLITICNWNKISSVIVGLGIQILHKFQTSASLHSKQIMMVDDKKDKNLGRTVVVETLLQFKKWSRNYKTMRVLYLVGEINDRVGFLDEYPYESLNAICDEGFPAGFIKDVGQLCSKCMDEVFPVIRAVYDEYQELTPSNMRRIKTAWLHQQELDKQRIEGKANNSKNWEMIFLILKRRYRLLAPVYASHEVESIKPVLISAFNPTDIKFVVDKEDYQMTKTHSMIYCYAWITKAKGLSKLRKHVDREKLIEQKLLEQGLKFDKIECYEDHNDVHRINFYVRGPLLPFYVPAHRFYNFETDKWEYRIGDEGRCQTASGVIKKWPETLIQSMSSECEPWLKSLSDKLDKEIDGEGL